jgi:predicted aldo/keto reductase-like oxidoreductase
VSVALSGMNTTEQVVEKVASACHSSSCDMTENELGLINRVKQKCKELGFNRC